MTTRDPNSIEAYEHSIAVLSIAIAVLGRERASPALEKMLAELEAKKKEESTLDIARKIANNYGGEIIKNGHKTGTEWTQTGHKPDNKPF